MASDTTNDAVTRSTGDGRIVIGRRITDRHRVQDYSSVMVDELIFFNFYLTPEEISVLGNLTSQNLTG